MGNLKVVMRADICDSDDVQTLERFQRLLRSYNAQLLRQSWGLGVEVHEWAIGDLKLTVFRDAWSVDIEGPAKLVRSLQTDLA